MKYGFIGFGNLAQAIYKGLKKEKGVSFAYFDKEKKGNKSKYFSSLEKLVLNSDAIFVCVKPQNLDEVLSELAKFDLTKKIIISPVAGKSIKTFEKTLGKKIVILRIMPNLAVAYKKSVTAYCTNKKNNVLVIKSLKLLGKLGVMLELKEEQFHLFTAILTSGSTLILKTLEMLQEKTEKLDISEKEKEKLLDLFLSGIIVYFQNRASKKIPELISAIASKGGITEAGLNYFEKNNLEKLMEGVLLAGENRSKEISR